MFVHGREAYRKNSYLVCYNFYKNALFVLPQYWFGFFSAFSGQTLYESVIYQFYNITFTSSPIVWYAIFDYQHTKEYFLDHPLLYHLGLKGKCFGTKVFWLWFSQGAIHAFIVLAICFYSFDISPHYNGHDNGLYISGSVVYFGVVVVANLKLLAAFNIFQIYGEILVFGSILCYLVILSIENSMIMFFDLYGIFPQIMGNLLTYFAIIFLVGVVVNLDSVVTKAREHFEGMLEKKQESRMIEQIK